MVKETTPSQITPMLENLCRDLNPNTKPLWVKVVPEDWALQSECFPNVNRKIEQDGGSAVNGWAIWQWANILIEAEAHCVWKSNSGELFDVTPHDYNEHIILFVPDSNVKFEGVMIPSKRAPMTASTKVNHLIVLLNTKDELLRRSGVSRVCAFPEPFIMELQYIIADITKKALPNDPCPCGSGLKYKKCCGKYDRM